MTKSECAVRQECAHAAVRDAERRRPGDAPYRRPVLLRGPVLAGIAAGSSISVENAPCWVARAAFGEGDFRWMIFRAWLLDDAPAWFRALYLRHGPAAGRWLAGRPRERALVRRMMLGAIRTKLRG